MYSVGFKKSLFENVCIRENTINCRCRQLSNSMWDILDNAICFNVSVFETHKLGFQDMKASPIILPLMKPLSPMLAWNNGNGTLYI